MALLRVKWSEIALQRIYGIADFIAGDSRPAAARWIASVFEEEKLIAENPYIGRMVPEFHREEYREVIVKNYRIIYKVIGKEIFVLTVIGSRELIYSLRTSKDL